ncbi:MAG: hypothetical protein LBM95_04560 [Lactobacillales bacterium]|jgi:hypothetical protein|nr:hypothetical protein [Lactobacillales bacterium]
MIKKLNYIIKSFMIVSILFLFGSNVVTFANDVATSENIYAIHIIKYMIDEEKDKEVTNNLPNDGSKYEAGNGLKTLGGINYEITKVESIGALEEKNFQTVIGEGAFSMKLLTNSVGEAVVNGLPAGYYRVTEMPNERIKEVMDPVVVQLPTQGRNEVYIYPKSSVITPNPTPSRVQPPDKLPQTSGNIGSYAVIAVTILILGVIGITELGFSLKKSR